MPDTEELKIVVSLDDQATAKLQQMRNTILGSFSGHGMDKLKKDQESVGKGFKDLIEVSTGGERAMLGFIGKVTAAGGALAAVGYTISDTAKKIYDATNKAKEFGIDRAEFVYMQEEFKKVGVSGEAAAKSIIGLNEAIVDISHPGSQKWVEMLHMAGMAGSDATVAMARLRQQLLLAHTEVQRMNALRDAGQAVYTNRLQRDMKLVKEGYESVETATLDAAEAQRTFLAAWGTDPEAIERLHRMAEMTDDARKRMDVLITSSREYEQAIIDLGVAADDTGKFFVTAFGPDLAKTIHQDAEDIKGIIHLVDELLEKLNEWTGTDKKGGAGAGYNKWNPMNWGADVRDWITTNRWHDQQPPAVAAPAQHFGGGMDAAIAAAGGVGNQFRHTNWDRFAREARASTNIEYAASYFGGTPFAETGAAPGGVTARGRLLDDNTRELKRLNDQLFQILNPIKGTQGAGFGFGTPSVGGRPTASAAAPYADITQGAWGAGPSAAGLGAGNAPGPTIMGGGTSTGTRDVNAAIDQAAKAYGFDPKTLKGIASIESSMEPGSNRDKSTQYKGLFQIGREEWNKYGGKGDIYNAADNAMAAAHMLADHKAWFKKQYGRDPADAELYMMHQQGRGFFSRGTMTNIGGNRYPGMSGPQTPESFMAGWGAELARREARFRGGGAALAQTGGGSFAWGGIPSGPGQTGGGGGQVGALQIPHPYHYGGDITVGGQTFRFASGGAARGSSPFGTYNIDFSGVGAQGRSGWGGRLPPAIAGVTTGEHGNVIAGDPSYPGAPREGIEIHSGASDVLDKLYTDGCFGIAPSDWPRFKQALMDEAKNAPGGKLRISVMPGQRLGQAVGRIGPTTPTGGGDDVWGKSPISYGATAAKASQQSPPRSSGPSRGDLASQQPAPPGGDEIMAPGTYGSADSDRLAVEHGRTLNHRVRGEGHLRVHVNAPAGTHVAAEGRGLFKQVHLHRQMQMMAAAPGTGMDHHTTPAARVADRFGVYEAGTHAAGG